VSRNLCGDGEPHIEEKIKKRWGGDLNPDIPVLGLDTLFTFSHHNQKKEMRRFVDKSTNLLFIRPAHRAVPFYVKDEIACSQTNG